VVNQLQGDAQKDLNNQVHHQMHDAHMDEHVAHKAPSLVTLVRIVDEQSGRRTAGALPYAILVVGIISERWIG